MYTKNTLYDHLRLSRTCSLEEIKKSYKKLALVYHPDKNPRGEEIFKMIVRAYKVLSDPGERKKYDKKIFGSSTPPLQKSPDTRVKLEVTLEELYVGVVKTVTVQKETLCSACSGMEAFFRCYICDNSRVINEQIPVMVRVEKGMMEGTRIKIVGEGGQKLGHRPGDLVVKLIEKKHQLFTRMGNNLLMEMKLSITDSLCGFSKTVETLDGRVLLMNEYSGNVTKDGTLRFVMDEGMPVHNNPSLKGKLIIKFVVEFPDTFDLSTIRKLEHVLPPRSPVNIPAAPEVISLRRLNANSKYGKLFNDHEKTFHL